MGERKKIHEKIIRIRERDSLLHLVGHAERLELVDGRAVVRDKLPAPVDEEFGIPRIDIMLNGLMGQMATENYMWTGAVDLHHMATPKADYTVVYGGLGQRFRGISQLKINMPRLAHKFAHELFQITRPTTERVMDLAINEKNQLSDLYEITRKRVEDPDRMLSAVHDVLGDMKEPIVGIMPGLDTLADMELDELRRTVASLVSVRNFGNRQIIHPALRPRSALRQKVA